jgi:hypothetical protein
MFLMFLIFFIFIFILKIHAQVDFSRAVKYLETNNFKKAVLEFEKNNKERITLYIRADHPGYIGQISFSK